MGRGQAEQWYLKSLAISEKQGNEHLAALTYQNLANLAFARKQILKAGELTLRAITFFQRYEDPHRTQRAIQNFLLFHKFATPTEQQTLETLWTQANLGPFPPQDQS